MYLSHYFKQHQQEYYDQLQSVRDRGTWEEWLLFFLRGVVEVSTQATETARLIVNLRETHRSTITDTFGRMAGNGHRVLEHLYKNPFVSVASVQKLVGTTYPAANELVSRFEESKILAEITGQARHRRFMYHDYIDLFHEDTVESPHD